jgi:aryl-alcohol dehydrogenase-like predicted oxidoreductase
MAPSKRPIASATRLPRVEHRILGRTGRQVSVVGLGAWQLGADWGDVAEDDAMSTLNAAVDGGVTFIDTADVYGDGRSERLVGRLLREHGGTASGGATGAGGRALIVATKMGRRVEQRPEAYTLDNFRAWNDRSRENLGLDTLDLVQLHCPPTEVYSREAVYDALDTMVMDKRIAAYGVSVETVDQALTAMSRPHVATVQIILNMLRLKPLERVLPVAASAGVAIIARVPLASGLLSGRYDEHTRFAWNDHRTFNRDGNAFDVGETFAGVPFEVGLRAVRRLVPLTPPGATTAQFALRWIIDQPGVSVVIPGARDAAQARDNAAAADLTPITPQTQRDVRVVYDDLVRERVHDRW